MTTRFIAICGAFVAGLSPLVAQNIDQVYVKNGSVYEGYISEQIPGKSLSVTTEKATLVVESSDVVSIEYLSRRVEELPERLQEWIDENRDSEERVDVATVSLRNDRQLHDVIVLEQGARLKLLLMADDCFTLAWSEILRTTKTANSDDAEAGIRDIITMKDGTRYEGQIIEQLLPEAEIKIRALDGVIYAADMKQVRSISSERIDVEIPLWRQTPLLDRVELKNGDEIEGFILSRRVGSEISMIDRQTGDERTIPLSEIAVYRKSVNSAYDPAAEAEEESAAGSNFESEPVPTHEPVEQVFETEASDDEVLVNGEPAKRLSVISYTRKVFLVKDPVTIEVAVSDTVRIEMPSVLHSQVRVVKTTDKPVFTSERLQLWTGTYPTYTEKAVTASLAQTDARYSMEEVDNGRRTLLTVSFLQPGTYVILPLDENSTCIAVQVKFQWAFRSK